jgi:co-chaperonin GroES (HSP10)
MFLCKGKKIFDMHELPFIPRGSKVLVKPDEPDGETVGGLVIPEMAKFRCSTGTVLAAGLAALDQMHDQGDEIGDRMVWGQLAGIWMEWDHIVATGKKKDCKHEGDWDRHPCTRDRTQAFACSVCGAIRWQESILLMDVDDLQASENVADRLRSGALKPVFDTTDTGKTQFRYVTTNGGN